MAIRDLFCPRAHLRTDLWLRHRSVRHCALGQKITYGPQTMKYYYNTVCAVISYCTINFSACVIKGVHTLFHGLLQIKSIRLPPMSWMYQCISNVYPQHAFYPRKLGTEIASLVKSQLIENWYWRNHLINARVEYVLWRPLAYWMKSLNHWLYLSLRCVRYHVISYSKSRP